jgi:Carboxypeptidase regulatory-like domain
MKGCAHGRSLLILAVTCASAFAQAAVLTGMVNVGPDASPVPGATASVRAEDGGEQRTIVTTRNGIYRFDHLQDQKTYRLEIESSGLKPFARSGILLRPGETCRMDVTLVLASRVESVTVTESAGDGHTTSAEVKQLIDSNQLHDLPSLNRTVSKFALMNSQVRPSIGLGADYQDANRLSIDAGSYRNTGYVLDGTTTYDWTYAVTP